MVDYSAPDAAAKPLDRQTRISALGEVSGYAVGLGAVYLADYLLPKQKRGAIDWLARQLGRWHGTGGEAQQVLAGKIADVTVMNLGGLVNMGTQFTLHRHAQPSDERTPLGEELGRVLTGRVAGTATAVGALTLASTLLPGPLASVEAAAGKLLGNRPRLGALAVSNLVQSLGALMGNVPAQLLYDRLAGQEKNRA